MTNIYAALEIGTSRTVLAIGEAETGGRLKVACHAEIPSTGVRKSQILDISQATQSIKSVLREVGRKQSATGDSITVGNAFLVVSGQHVKADPYQGTAQVAGSKVSADDINEVVRSSQLMSLPRDRELLDIVEQAYELDGLEGIVSPKGMSGRVLKLDTLQIHADKNRIDNARTAAAEAHLEIRDPLFAATCAADAVLSPADRRNGALVLDLGGGSTGWTVCIDGYPVLANAIGIGGDHVTSDISYAFQTTQAQAEELKRTEANAVVGADRSASARVKLPGFSPLMEGKTVSRKALDTVVNLRLKELLSLIRMDLEDRDLLHRLNAGAVLTGGGAAQRGIEALVAKELGLPARIGVPLEIGGLEHVPNPASFAAISGALVYAHRNYEEKSFFGSFFKGLFK
ncbi:MAG: cell division protein FtsA [Kiritimatiellae bacterium]|nr:cell division protein FtsA [Kiritimatiellia bacterium]